MDNVQLSPDVITITSSWKALTELITCQQKQNKQKDK